MLYRRKVVLAILKEFGGSLPKISLQKLLFLFTREQSAPSYDFVPYHYGCYSFSAAADLLAMVKHGQLVDGPSGYAIANTTVAVQGLKQEDSAILKALRKKFARVSPESLMKHTYAEHHYYAINSVKAAEILSTEELDIVKKARPVSADTTLFTIGYEGISLEEYLNRLIRNDIKLLIDVRNNPMSMKFGFSKSQLKKYCEYLGIAYKHIPEVGIRSEYRQELNTQNDYDRLFDKYKSSTLRTTLDFQEQILTLVKENKRVALTCFEANVCQCHRSHLATAITKLPGWNYSLKHI